MNIEIEKDAVGLHRKRVIAVGLRIPTQKKGFRFLIQAMSDLVEISLHLVYNLGVMTPIRQESKTKHRRLGRKVDAHLIDFILPYSANHYHNAGQCFFLPGFSEANPTLMVETPTGGIHVGIGD